MDEQVKEPHVKLVITPDLIIDGTGASPQRERAVVVDDGRIERIVARNEAPTENVHRIDAPGSTLLPGLIDLHFHQFLLLVERLGGPTEQTFRKDELIATKILKAARAAKIWLQSGVTTIRDAGAGQNLAVAMKEAIADGFTEGPRVFASGALIAQTGGLRAGNEDIAVEVTGADEARRAARQQLKAGVDVLKIYGASSIGGGGGRLVGPPGWPQLTVEEIRAVVEEAHKADRLCSAHAVSTQSIKNVILAGVDWVDHADFLDNETIDMLLETNTPIVPTQVIAWSLEHFGEDMGFGPHIAKKAAEVGAIATEGLRKAFEAGVIIAAGTDADNPRASLAKECELLTEAGMTPLQAIAAATATPAKILRVANELGTIAEGKIADMILVNGNPAEDIRTLQKVTHVVQGGKPLALPLVDLSRWGY
jgi:imidazolonepropionase-like amidohydrolase